MSSQSLLLQKERTCIQNMNWKLCCTPELDLLSFATSVQNASEWVDKSTPGLNMIVLLHEEGHRIFIVPATNRIQLRLHYTSPIKERPELAQSLYQRILHLLP